MLAVCERCPQALAHATKALKDDKQFVVAAIASDPAAFCHASRHLHNNRSMVRSVLSMKVGIFTFPSLANTKFQERLGCFYDKDKPFFLQLISASNDIEAFYSNLSNYLQRTIEIDKTVLLNDSLTNNTMVKIAAEVSNLGSEEIIAAVRKGFLTFLKQANMEELLVDKDFVFMLCHVSYIMSLVASRAIWNASWLLCNPKRR